MGQRKAYLLTHVDGDKRNTPVWRYCCARIIRLPAQRAPHKKIPLRRSGPTCLLPRQVRPPGSR